MTIAVSEPSQAPAVEPQAQSVPAAEPVIATPQTSVESDQDRNWRQTRESLQRERQEREYWQGEATRLRAAPKPVVQEEDSGPAKTLADFEFNEANYARYLSEQVTRNTTEAVRKELQQERDAQIKRERVASFETRQQAFAKDNPGYHEAVSNPAFTQSDALLDELMESTEGAAIAMYLANNLDITRKLNQMSAVQVAREVARLEVKVTSEREKAKTAKNQIPASDQPAPTPRLSGEGDSGRVSVDSPESDTRMDADEWARRRNKQEARRRAKD